MKPFASKLLIVCAALAGAPAGRASGASDPVRAGELGSASLFVDDGGAPNYPLITFNVSGEATTSTVQFLLQSPAAWSLGSFNALSIVGTFPINSFWPTATGLQTQTLLAGDPLTLNGLTG